MISIGVTVASTNSVGNPSMSVATKCANGQWVDSRKSWRSRLSRRLESEVNISTLTTISPTVEADGSAMSTTMSPPITVVVPTVVFSVPASRSFTT